MVGVIRFNKTKGNKEMELQTAEPIDFWEEADVDSFNARLQAYLDCGCDATKAETLLQFMKEDSILGASDRYNLAKAIGVDLTRSAVAFATQQAHNPNVLAVAV